MILTIILNRLIQCSTGLHTAWSFLKYVLVSWWDPRPCSGTQSIRIYQKPPMRPTYTFILYKLKTLLCKWVASTLWFSSCHSKDLGYMLQLCVYLCKHHACSCTWLPGVYGYIIDGYTRLTTLGWKHPSNFWRGDVDPCRWASTQYPWPLGSRAASTHHR